MKSKIITGAILAMAVAALPAHAISEKYRAELERNHTTQAADAGYKPQKTRTYKGFGVTVKRSGDQVYIDGKPAAMDENEATAQTFSAGLYNVIFYKNGKVSLMNNGQYVGDLK